MDTSEIMVTPEMAQQWLDTQATNRGLSREHVKNWVHAMRNGEFSLAPGGISFDKQGRLRDGQHRLHAVVICGIAQLFRVHRNCSEKGLASIDQGRPRTTADAIRMSDDDKFACNKTPVVRMFVGLERRCNVKISESVYRDVARRLGTEHLDAVCNIPRSKVAGAMLAALVYARPVCPDVVDLLRDKMVRRELLCTREDSLRLFGTDSSPNRTIVLEAMGKCLTDKLHLHHSPTDSMLKFMRGIQAFVENEKLITLQASNIGYEYWQKERARVGAPERVANVHESHGR